MNLQMKVIEGDFCLTDADSGEYWRLFSGSCYENLSGCPIHIKSTSTPLSVLDIYSLFPEAFGRSCFRQYAALASDRLPYRPRADGEKSEVLCSGRRPGT